MILEGAAVKDIAHDDQVRCTAGPRQVVIDEAGLAHQGHERVVVAVNVRHGDHRLHV